MGVREDSSWYSPGSKVTADFQRDIGPILGVQEYGPNKVRHMQTILESVAIPWNSARHSSDEADNPGGNVTKEAYQDLLAALQRQAAEEEEVEDRRAPSHDPSAEFVQRSIRLRRGQARFRDGLLRAYNGTCAVTGSTARAVLEAAHIVPFAEGGQAHTSNGLLLRADIHTLFDLRLIAMDSRDWTLLVDESLEGTEYSDMRGSVVWLPHDRQDAPNVGAIDWHRELSGL